MHQYRKVFGTTRIPKKGGGNLLCTLLGRKCLNNQDFEPLVPQMAHDRDTMLLLHWYNLKWLKISYYRYKLEYLVVSGHVMAIYLKWHMCPCHEPLVAQIEFVQILYLNFSWTSI